MKTGGDSDSMKKIRKTAMKKFFAFLDKGLDLGGYKMYKNRDELYDRD